MPIRRQKVPDIDVEYWLNKAYSTEPIDRTAAVEAIQNMYAYCEQPNGPLASSDIKFYPSPQAALNAIIPHRLDDGPGYKSSFRRPIADRVMSLFYSMQGAPNVTGSGVLAQLVGDHLYTRLLRSVYPAARPRVNVLGGNWQCTRAIIKEDPEARDVFTRYTRECHFTLPFEDLVLLSERPTIVCVDDEGRLHNPNGPALAYKDGFSIYALEGIVVPAWAVDDNLSHEAIMRETNIEIRRVILKRYGLERFLLEEGYATKGPRDRYGQLFEIGGGHYVRVVNSSPEPDGSYKVYVLPTSPFANTPKEAVARSFGIHEGAYKPVIET